MNGSQGPSPGFLALLNQGLGGPPAPTAPQDFTAQAGQALGFGPAPAAPAPVMLGGQPIAPPAPPPGPPPPAPPPPAGPPPSALDGGMSKMPEAGMSQGPPPPAPPPPPRFVPGGGGFAPAHEVERRGPSLKAAQDTRNAEMQGAIDAVNERNQQTSAAEFAMALDQQKKAQIREDAANYSAAEREDELAQRQADFDQSVKALSKMSVDPNRFWASRSTGQKIAGFVSIFLGGMLQGMRGGPNAGLDIVNEHIDRDIKAQEFAYNAARDTAQAKQTAFAMAMQKYGNVDAARAMARASALDAIQAQVAQMGAQWKGTDAANRAQMAVAALQDEKMQQIAQGIMFLPASVAPRMYVDQKTGLRYTEAEMKKRQDTAEERDFKRDEQLTGIGGQAYIADLKERAAAQAKAGEHAVRLPTGEIVQAPDADTAKQLREASVSLAETQRLTGRAKEILADSTWRASPEKRDLLRQVQTDLMQNYGVAHKMGALSDKDYENAIHGTADLFSLSPGKESALDALNRTAAAKLGAQVQTIPGATAPRASGQMPASTTYHGGK